MITQDLSDAFFTDIIALCDRLSCDPHDILGVMMSESGVQAWEHNPGGAVGLIQFEPTTLKMCGYAGGVDEFAKLTADDQLPFVETFFSAHKGQLTSGAACYVATFLPVETGKASNPSAVLCGSRPGDPFDWAYNDNKIFDHAGKGYITVQDMADQIARSCHGARWSEILDRLHAAQAPCTSTP